MFSVLISRLVVFSFIINHEYKTIQYNFNFLHNKLIWSYYKYYKSFNNKTLFIKIELLKVTKHLIPKKGIMSWVVLIFINIIIAQFTDFEQISKCVRIARRHKNPSRNHPYIYAHDRNGALWHKFRNTLYTKTLNF